MKLSQNPIVSSCYVLLTFMQTVNAFSTRQQHQHLQTQSTGVTTSRKDFLQKASSAFGTSLLLPTLPVFAEEPVELPTQEVVTKTFDSIRFELADPGGGVAYMQQRIEEQDFVGLMEFTKTYDQELRKLRIGRAKKLIQSKEVKEEATGYANAVTFDLIGINRNSRKGQESADGANKYLQELREDVNKFLSLESTINTEG
jgi:hypothetical protein